MYSNKRSLFGTFIFVLVLIACVVLCYFSLSDAIESEVAEPAVIEEGVSEEVDPEVVNPEEGSSGLVAEDPVVEPAGEEAVVEDKTGKELGAEPIGGPLDVYLGNRLATTTECTYDGTTYRIIADGLTFVGDGGPDPVTASIEIDPSATNITNVTLNKVNITLHSPASTVSLIRRITNLTLNIINHCSLENTEEGYGLSVGNFNEFVINGDSSSSLLIKSKDHDAFELNNTSSAKAKITGGVSLNATTSSSEAALATDIATLIIDTTGKVVFDTDYLHSTPNANAIYSASRSFNLIVNKGILELHAPINEDAGSGAIYTKNVSADNIIQLGPNVKMVGAKSADAELGDCTEGVNMKNDKDVSPTYSLSYIDEDRAGTVIFYYVPPAPTPGGDMYETAKTADSIPGTAIAMIALVALGSFALLRSRIKNN